MPIKFSAFPFQTKYGVADRTGYDIGGLFARLTDGEIRCALYKNCSAIETALAGSTDLDLLVSEEDLTKVRGVMTGAGGIRGYPCRYYDNAIPEREDWFVPTGEGRVLHLDLAHAVMTGPKFHKRYRALEFGDLLPTQVEKAEPEGLLRVTPAVELQIALLRAAFRINGWIPGRWLRADGDLGRMLGEGFPPGARDHEFTVDLGMWNIRCAARRDGSRLFLDRRAMRDIRQAVRRRHAIGPLVAWRDWAIHWTRRASFSVMRRITRRVPGREANKRRLRRGCVVALVGPDGVGKSTQSVRLREIFGRKFRSTTVYLGSNDGSWMKFRGKLRLARTAHSTVAAAVTNPAPSDKKRNKGERGAFHSVGSAIWRLAVAGNRYLGMRRALRLAKSGTLVITDRCPQNIEEGILDGPSAAPASRYRLALMLWQLEKRLYRAMAGFAPDFTIHLECDYASSHARKPGDIDPADFDRRIALMRTMQERDCNIAVIDARADIDTVTRQLFALIWQQLLRMA